MKEVGLYIHIPFCKSKCSYCDFNSYDDKNDIIGKYIEALLHEIELYKNIDHFSFKTIFIGGGTPTHINCFFIGKIIDAIRMNTINGAEISIECNPGTVNEESLKYYRKSGINRLSIGLQAWQNELLKSIGRIHSSSDFVENINAARKAGFENINADLMFALPNQTIEMWEETLHKVCSLQPEHLSCYSLKLEEGTKLYKLFEAGKVNIPDDETDREMYHRCIQILKDYGYHQYEISNFAKAGCECRHNLIYWNNEEYIGVGAGSHSKLDNKRYWNFKDLRKYISKVSNEELPIEDQEIISLKDEMWESIFLSLRLNSGLDVKVFERKYNIDFDMKYGDKLKKMEKEGLISYKFDNIRLTQKGIDLSNSVFIEFI